MHDSYIGGSRAAETASPFEPEKGLRLVNGERIAIVLPNLRGGGVERLSVLLAQEFIERGLEVDLVLLRREGELVLEAPTAARIVDLNAKRFRNGAWPLIRYLRRERPSAVLAAMWPLTGMVALTKLVAHSNCRLVVSEHNALSHTPAYRGWSRRIHRLIGGWLYQLADGVVCVSQGVREDILANTSLSSVHAHVIYNPVRRPSQPHQALDPAISAWWHSSDSRLLAVGSLKSQKDFPTLLKALARLRQTKDARLLILGEGALRSDLETIAASIGLQDNVLMPGFIPDTYPYLEQANLFVLSSAWEGLGNVIIEALVAGVPVVSTDCPSGPAEILKNGKFGRLVPVGDSEAMAAAIGEALEAPVDRDFLRRRGNEFSVERAADQYLALLFPGGKKLAGR